MPRIAYTSVGCKLNRYEIQVMSETLRQSGFITVPFNQKADCYVINTCSVTGDADFSSRQLIRRARRRAPDSKIIVTGCYAQLKPDELAELNVDVIISNRDKNKLPSIILELFGFNAIEHSIDSDHIITGMHGMTRAFVKIQDGCDDKCAFCTIWLARGPVESRPAKFIIDEINKLSSNNFKEIALTGVHIGKYQFEDLAFVDLLRELMSQTSIDRIRLSSLNPSEITVDLVDLIASESRICPHIHLSIQSGDDEVLKSMGRRYGKNDINSAIETLSRKIPNITIGADFIVGFPGESDDKFENTRRLIEEANLHHLHIFPYSDRPGTVASEFCEKIEPAEKARRTAILRNLGHNKKQKHLANFFGKRLHVLFENRNLADPNALTGLSENYLRINVFGVKDLKGTIVEVIPREIKGEVLLGELLSERKTANRS
jgi:threonylcarbamoyladenosine tRNA methylthiotransferase MtaB